MQVVLWGGDLGKISEGPGQVSREEGITTIKPCYQTGSRGPLRNHKTMCLSDRQPVSWGGEHLFAVSHRPLDKVSPVRTGTSHFPSAHSQGSPLAFLLRNPEGEPEKYGVQLMEVQERCPPCDGQGSGVKRR